MKALVAGVLLIPAVAFAQPYDPNQPPPPPGTGQPPSPYPPAPAPNPAPPPYGQPPPPGYQQPPPPQYQQPMGTARRGVTFEANVGIGYVRLADDNNGTGSNTVLNGDAALAGANIGVGGWLNPHLAISARIAGVQFKFSPVTDGQKGNTVNAFFGPSAQYWFDDHAWAGGGIGFATFRTVGGDSNSSNGTNGFGFDLRGGYSFGSPGSNHTFNVSLEINPCFYSDNGSSGTATSVALLAGYQYL